MGDSVGTWPGVALTAVSLPVTVGGFWIAIAQIRKTAGAADASARSAAATLATVRELQLRDGLSRLVGLSREIESTRAAAVQRRLVSDWLDHADAALALSDGAPDDFVTALAGCRTRMHNAKILLWTPVSEKKPELRTAILEAAGEARRLAIIWLTSGQGSTGGTRS